MARRRVTVNLAPADLRKEGSAFDLAIAVGILVASEQIRAATLADFALLGELSLDGNVRPVRGLLPMATGLGEHEVYAIIVAKINAREAAMAGGPLVYPVESLAEAVEVLEGAFAFVPVWSMPTRHLLEMVARTATTFPTCVDRNMPNEPWR
jgi:magnesium chelatase family protein